MATNPTLPTVEETARAVRAGEMRPADLVAECERSAREAEALNALVFDRYVEVLDALGSEGSSGVSCSSRAGPLAGVPFTVKDTIALAGAPFVAGSVMRSHLIADRDATVVARLRAAGAIPVARTNTSELGLWIETENPVHGRTLNPHDVARSCGGSSGGDAVAVAVGASHFGVADDFNGSNRIAAAWCGVVGFKPSAGRVPTTGRVPVFGPRTSRYAPVGFVARTARDLEVLLGVVSGPDGVDASVTHAVPPGPVSGVEFRWKRVVVCDDLGEGATRPEEEVRGAVHRAAAILGEDGGDLETWRPVRASEASRIWMAMVHEGNGVIEGFETLLGSPRVSLFRELTRMPIGRSRHTVPTLGFVALERLTKGYYFRVQQLCAAGRRLQHRVNAQLADGGVMLLPTMPTVAPRPSALWSRPTDFIYAGLANVLELPSVSVPMGLSREGLPLAVQVVAAHGRDDVAIAAAMRIEARVGVVRAPRRPEPEA